jgi:hypothetical protein
MKILTMVLWLEQTTWWTSRTVLKNTQGGRLVLGRNLDGKRRYYPATILADLEPGMEGFEWAIWTSSVCDSSKRWCTCSSIS